MGKQSMNRRETEVSTDNGVGKQLEQTVVLEDNVLPSPQELEAYKRIDPRIVDHLLVISKDEQAYRHKTELIKMRILRNSEKRTGRINWWGMFFAFLSITLFLVVAAFALYLDHPWFAAFFGVSSLVSIVSIFVKNDDDKKITKK